MKLALAWDGCCVVDQSSAIGAAKLSTGGAISCVLQAGHLLRMRHPTSSRLRLAREARTSQWASSCQCRARCFPAGVNSLRALGKAFPGTPHLVEEHGSGQAGGLLQGPSQV